MDGRTMHWLQIIGVILYTIGTCFASDVLEFTDSNFKTKASEHDFMLIEFYAPWCGHCKRLAPEYEKAATVLKSNDPPVPLAKVDCTAETEICKKYDVSGYPTLKLFRNGEFSQEYQGPREADGIVKYLKSQAGPSSKELKSVEEYEKFVDNFEHGIIGLFSDAKSKLKKEFMSVADGYREEGRFAHTTNEDVLKKAGDKDTIILHRPKRLASKFEEGTVKYGGDVDQADIKSWLQNEMHGVAGHRTTANNAQFKAPLVNVYYDVDYVRKAKASNYWRNRVMKVAEKLKDKDVNFAVSSADDFNNELDEFGLSYVAGDNPVVGARDEKGGKFVMTEDFSMDNLEAFVNDFLDGKLKPYLKSEPIPDNNDPVKVAVAENFEDLVNDESKDVLIEFYAPWCGHCKSLAPKYEELAEKLSSEEDIVIAKMDATANDVPSPYEVRGFPTLYFAPKGNKSSPKKYEGGREVKDFIEYLAKESTDELKGWDRKGKVKKVDL